MPLLLLAIGGLIVFLLFEGNNASASDGGSGGGGGFTDSSAGNNNLQNFAQGIFQFEGNGGPNATNSWNNNPGNIGGGQNTYATVGDGWQSLYNFITSRASDNPDWNFFDFFENYLGQLGNPNATSQGNPTAYANYVANYVGADPNQSVWDFINGGG